MQMQRRKMSGRGGLLGSACLLSAIGLATASGQDRDEDRGGGTLRNGRSAFTVISTTVDPDVTSPLRKVDTVVQVGGDARNRFTMHRIKKPPAKRRGHRGSIILVPSLVNSFHEYMIGDDHDAMQSLAATLALADYAVYGYSPRTAHLPLGGCTSGTVDCSVMKDWGFSAYLSDIDYIRQRVEHEQHGKPAIGGLSLGGMLGVAAVNANPAGYSGLLFWDAILYSADPTIVGLNNTVCANLRAAIAAGNYYEEGLPAVIKQLAQMGEAGAVQFFGNPQPALGTPNFIQLVADEAHTRFQHASFPRVFDFVMAFNNVEALGVLRDAQCSFAGDRTFTANLRRFRAPVFAIQQGQGFGPYMFDTIGLMRSRRVRLQDNPEFGHLDAYLAADHATYVEGPILDWLDTDVFPNDDDAENGKDERDD